MEDLDFQWDSANIGHLALRGISPNEAEQVIRNRPCDLESSLRNGEVRFPHIGEADDGKILVVITTSAENKIRIVTAWPANKSYRRYFLSLKRQGNVGRIEEKDVRD